MLALLSLALAAHAAAPRASSTGATEAGKHPVDLAFDGLLSTGWAEGVAVDGAGGRVEELGPRELEVLGHRPAEGSGRLRGGARVLDFFEDARAPLAGLGGEVALLAGGGGDGARGGGGPPPRGAAAPGGRHLTRHRCGADAASLRLCLGLGSWGAE